jgi:CheY-like chemotaxis protein
MMKNSKHILVADDDPMYRDVAQATLELAGHRVTIAGDGGAAIALLEDTAFDAAIIDLTMPVADGISVIGALRNGSLNATIPVIVITGHDDAQAVERAYLAGATSFLTKPLNWLLFTPHIEFVLRSGQTEKELREASTTAAFLSDLKSQVMQALAQEFQSPIKTIFGFSELIQREVYGPLVPSQYKEMMADISKSASSLNASLLKVLDFGHTLTQHLDVKSEPINAADCVRDAISAVEPLAQRRGIRIAADYAIAASMQITADRALLNQALRGVIENAIRMSQRDSEIIIRVELSADLGLNVTVSDKGPAHPLDFLLEVNGSIRTTPNFASAPPSSGVSIKIAKVLVEAHKGNLTLKSDTMTGNVVQLTFPRHNKSAGIEPQTQQQSNPTIGRLAQISAELSQDPRLKERLSGNASILRPASRTGGQP